MEQRIRVTIADGVADVRLSRPDKMNALDQAMFEALVDTGSSLLERPGLRAVVISGEQVQLLGSANQKEAVVANLQKRAPNFAEVDPGA